MKNKINEKILRSIIREALQELDWKTYANAAKKAHQWRSENPYKYDRNRGHAFDRAAVDAFNRDMGIDNTDISNYGGERGNINMNMYHGNPEISGSRNHDFGDGESGPFMIKHNIYHMGKKYGKDGGYGRTRMWDYARETTPEEFYGDDEMGRKFRDAEAEVDAYKNGDYGYSDEKGWHLNEKQLRNVIREWAGEWWNVIGNYPDPPQYEADPEPEYDEEEYQTDAITFIKCLYTDYFSHDKTEVHALDNLSDKGIFPETAIMTIEYSYRGYDLYGFKEDFQEETPQLVFKYGDGRTMTFDELINYLSSLQIDGIEEIVNIFKSAQKVYNVEITDLSMSDWESVFDECNKMSGKTKQQIRLNEKQLIKIIKESIGNILDS